MTEKNEWKPSRWTPPADLEEAFQEGRSTRKLPDGSTAVLSWAPEMEDRWWSEDGSSCTGLQVDNQDDGPQLVPYSAREGSGVLFVRGSEMEDYLSQANDTAPEGQPWAYCPPGSDISNVNTMKNFSTKVSFAQTPAIIVSHDGRIVLSARYSSDALGYAMGQAVESEEQSEFYIDHLFKLLRSYLHNSVKDTWPKIHLNLLVETLNFNNLNKHERYDHNSSAALNLVDSKRARLVDKQCAKMLEIQGWLRSLPAWASMIIDSSLVNGGGLSILTGDVIKKESTIGAPAITEAQHEAVMANRCYGLLQIINGEIITSDDQPISFKELIEEYGPGWLMQMMPAFDPDPNDELSAIDLTPNGDKWTIRTDHDSVLQACRLAGAMNAPIELWPRFYKILESAGPLRLDEITILMMLAVPLHHWRYLKNYCNGINEKDVLLREVCYLIAADMSVFDLYSKDNKVQEEVLANISPDRPITGQMVDLAMALDNAIIPLSSSDYQSIARLITENPDMNDTINGASLIARNLNRMNVNEN